MGAGSIESAPFAFEPSKTLKMCSLSSEGTGLTFASTIAQSAPSSQINTHIKTTFLLHLNTLIMKRFSFHFTLATGLFILFLTNYACQKESVQLASSGIKDIAVGDRATPIYGVTVFSAGNPSQLVLMDASGAVQSTLSLFIDNGLGQPIAIDDLKGVCWVNGRLFVTTGFHAVDAYSFMLAEVKTSTGELSKLSNSTIGAISDIDYDQPSSAIYGLANNANRLVSILDNGNAWNIYNTIGNITNLGGSYIAKGLTLLKTANGSRLAVAATTANFGNAQLYQVPFTAGAATLLSVINPANDLATGHCGLGYDAGINSVLINRRASAGFGLNSFAWNPPLPNPTNSAFWGGTGSNFEDLTTSL